MIKRNKKVSNSSNKIKNRVEHKNMPTLIYLIYKPNLRLIFLKLLMIFITSLFFILGHSFF